MALGRFFELDAESQAHARSLPGPILILGAGGFVGFNLFQSLSALRSDVFAVVHRLNAGWRLGPAEVPASRLLICDLNFELSVDHLVDSCRPRTVFNLAAYGAYSHQQNAGLIYRTNFLSTIHLLEALKLRGFDAYVHAGSSSEYGLHAAGPDEAGEPIPNSHYAVSKLGNANLLKFYGRIHGLPVVNLRLYSVYGPWEEPDRLIPALIEKAREKKLPPLVSPEISRDYLYVTDAARAFIAAARRMSPRIHGESFNIATGRRTTMRDLAALARSTFQVEAEPVFGSMPNRRWDVENWYGNPAKAADLLGWKAAIGLEEGLRSTFAWQAETDYAGMKSRYVSQGEGKATEISAIVACYKDAQAIPEMHARLAAEFNRLEVTYEIIFVNDCSPDHSRQLLRELSIRDGNVLVVEHSRNFGSQSAFVSGMGVASGKAVVLLDGDLQDPPEVIGAFHAKWKEGFDVVYGRRVKREAPFLLNLAYKAFYRLFRRMSYISVPTDAGDFSLIDRKVVDEILSLPEKDQFLRGLRAWVGFRQTGVAYVRPERKYGISTNNLLKNIQWAKKGIFSFTYLPLEVMGYAGAALFLLSLLGILFQVVGRLLHPDLPRGISTIIVLVLFLGGTQLLGMAVLGEYIGKIFEEAKSRPHFIRHSLTHAGVEYSGRDRMRDFLANRKNAARG
ncbi:MAG TPA: NAD-dependent epimerase/dehydratase family protein [Fibrobacteria bacterium]|nr:NAD-dependent epimerase/dehydratase family protein [Fibrobacteria bacterium]